MQNGELFSIIENENAKAQSEFKTNNTYTMAGSLSVTHWYRRRMVIMKWILLILNVR